MLAGGGHVLVRVRVLCVLVLAGRGSCVLACSVLACLPVEGAEKKVQQTSLGGEMTPMGCVGKPGLAETTPQLFPANQPFFPP